MAHSYHHRDGLEDLLNTWLVTLQICRAESTAATDIKLVCLDVDGTLLNSREELTPAVEEAIKAAREAGVQVYGDLAEHQCV